jgi:hypothetical protein
MESEKVLEIDRSVLLTMALSLIGAGKVLSSIYRSDGERILFGFISVDTVQSAVHTCTTEIKRDIQYALAVKEPVLFTYGEDSVLPLWKLTLSGIQGTETSERVFLFDDEAVCSRVHSFLTNVCA